MNFLDKDNDTSGHLFAFSLFIIIVFTVSACGDLTVNPLNKPTALSYSDLPALTIEDLSVEEAVSYYQDPISQEIFQGIDQMTQAGFQSLYTRPRFGPTIDNLSSGKYVILEPGQTLNGFLLWINTMEVDHDFGLLTTLDYTPIQINYNHVVQTFPVIHSESGNWRAFRFSLPPLSEGLHTLIVTYVVEPYLNLSVEFDPFEMDTIGWRDAPFEFGLLIWVTSQPPKSAFDWPEQARTILPEQTTDIGSIGLFKEKPLSPDDPDILLLADQVRAGEQLTYYLRPSSSGGVAGSIPLRMLVYWDDKLENVEEINISVQTAIEMDYLPYRIKVPQFLSEGLHYLTVVAYPYPYYLRGWKERSEWSPNVSFYSHLVTRLPVTVVKP